MKLPPGNAVEQGLQVKKTNFTEKTRSLMENEFSGYVALTIEGFEGMEEAILILKSGSLLAASYSYLNFDVTVYGDYALPQVVNAASAEHGIMDIVALSASQVDLITAFQEKSILRKVSSLKDLEKMTRKNFTDAYAGKVLEKVREKSPGKDDVLKKFGLSGIRGGEK